MPPCRSIHPRRLRLKEVGPGATIFAVDPVRPLDYEAIQGETQDLLAAWTRNLALAEPNRQRVFRDYQKLTDARARLEAWLREKDLAPERRDGMRMLAADVSACLGFVQVAPVDVARLRRQLFAGRSRGCHGGPTVLERELLQSLMERAAG